MDKILKQLDKEIALAYYEACKQLMTPLTDNEFERLCAENPEVFSKLSKLDLSKLEDFIPEMRQVVQIMHNFKRGISIDEYEAMTRDEVIEYIDKLYDKSRHNIYNTLKQLEQ